MPRRRLLWQRCSWLLHRKERRKRASGKTLLVTELRRPDCTTFSACTCCALGRCGQFLPQLLQRSSWAFRFSISRTFRRRNVQGLQVLREGGGGKRGRISDRAVISTGACVITYVRARTACLPYHRMDRVEEVDTQPHRHPARASCQQLAVVKLGTRVAVSDL